MHILCNLNWPTGVVVKANTVFLVILHGYFLFQNKFRVFVLISQSDSEEDMM